MINVFRGIFPQLRRVAATARFSVMTFIDHDNDEHEIDIDDDCDHVQELVSSEGINFGVCGGEKLCGTCQVHVLKGMEGLSPMGEEEEETLGNLSYEPIDISRLACGIEVTDALDGVVFKAAPLKPKK